MHRSNNSDFKTHGTRIFVKNLSPDSSVGRPSSGYCVTSDQGSLPSFNGSHLQNAAERQFSGVPSRCPEPEFIETDFTSPLTELSRPLSLDASNGDDLPREPDTQLGFNKRPYSANQLPKDAMPSHSLTLLNIPRTFPAPFQGHKTIRLMPQSKSISGPPVIRGRYSDTVAIFAKTTIVNSTNSNIISFSQKSSPIQITNVTPTASHRFVSILPRAGQNKMPNLMLNPNISTHKATNIKIVLPATAVRGTYSTRPILPKALPNVVLPRYIAYPHPPECTSSIAGTAVGSPSHSSPLNLSSKDFPERKGARPNSIKNLLSYFNSPDQDLRPKILESPLNLISKGRQNRDSVSIDLSLSTSLPGTLEPSIHNYATVINTIAENLPQSASPKHIRNLTNSFVLELPEEPPSHLKLNPSDGSLDKMVSPDTLSNNGEALQSPKLICHPNRGDPLHPTSFSSPRKAKVLVNSRENSNFRDASLTKSALVFCRSKQGNEEEFVQQELDDDKFTWDDYLEHCGADAVPSAVFKHVECSLQNGLKKGMLVEVANRDPAGTYWVASIIMPCGQLLMLRPACCQNGASLDFWCDVSTYELHPLGWCSSNQKQICPPKDLVDKVLTDWESAMPELLENSETPPPYMLDQRAGSLPFDQIHAGMIYEVQDKSDPNTLWFARVLENVGGRLLLRYEGCSNTFWLFYTSHRLYPPGHSLKNNKRLLPPREVVNGNSESVWRELLAKCSSDAVKNSPPPEMFKDQEVIEKHAFREGWRIELLDVASSKFRVAHVSEVISEYYFMIESDVIMSRDPPIKCCCHRRSPVIFPIGWHKQHGLQLLPVPGHPLESGLEFEWSKYLELISSEAAPSECFAEPGIVLSDIEKDMKLEATDLRRPEEICVATVADVKGPLLWVKLDHEPSSIMIFSHDSHNLFPIGWCESNNYHLKAPIYKSVARLDRPQSDGPPVAPAIPQINEPLPKKASGWCPKIYFNTKCYSGPFLSKWRLHLLPKSIGPGSVVSVMTTVLTKLITSAYKSSRVLRELQLDGPPNQGMHQQILKTKYNTKIYSAAVEICTSGAQVEKYCKDICRRLICCPNLISIHSYPALCPENCLKIAKSKHYFHFGERRRQVGRPRGGHSNIEHVPSEERRMGHRRKRRYKKKLMLTLRKKHGCCAAVVQNSASEAEGSTSETAACRVDSETNGLEMSENEDSIQSRSRVEQTKPPETVTKFKIVCSQELEDGNKSYMVCNGLKESQPEKSKPVKRKCEARDEESDNRRKVKDAALRKYDVQTRGISLTKNYLFEKKTHKKMFIVPPMNVATDVLQPPKAQNSIPQIQVEKDKPPIQNSLKPADSGNSLKLTSNPAEWSVQEVASFIKTTDCAKLAKIFRDQEIDGKSLLLLTLPTVQEFIEPKLGPAVKLCDLIERLKHFFFCRYATTITV